MTKLVNIVLFFVLLVVVIPSCSNDFVLTEGQEVPIIYGIIDMSDTATYIRVEKAFVSEGISALELAQDPQNLYFDDIEVVLVQASTGKEFPLSRVDGNLEGYVRQVGAFASAPNYLYKIKNAEVNFRPKEEFKLRIQKNDGSVLTEASTRIMSLIEDKDLTVPSPSGLLSFVKNTDFEVKWFFDDDDGAINDVSFIFYYDEIKNGVTESKELEWFVGRNLDNSIFEGRGNAFYQYLSSSIEPDPNVIRLFRSATVKVTSGREEIRDYIDIYRANLGITSSGEIPVYSNFNNDAVGLFSSKMTYARNNVGLAKSTLDSLKGSVETKNLNFR